ncbi:MAG: hypothetical protein HND52_00785 [Ignavibacteriae bacterium]|nr:hypothetical protein [Ignavibacteriota bacterium]NOG96483.1 hypothetical protein [Ignavibacteriota bacterium]
MKHNAYLIILVLVSIFGCSENQNITSPIVESSFEKVNDPANPNHLNTEKATILLDIEPQWVPLPLPGIGNPQGPNYFEVSKMIYKNRLNHLYVQYTYEVNENDSVKLSAKLTFFPGVIEPDSLLVTAKIDTRNGTLVFEPHTQFNYSVYLDYKIEGIDTDALLDTDIDFAYGGADGVLEYINYMFLNIDPDENSLYMFAGRLQHFSRYGFVRRNVNH